MNCVYDNIGKCVAYGTVPVFGVGHIMLAIFAAHVWERVFVYFCSWFLLTWDTRLQRIQIVLQRYLGVVAGIVTANLVIDYQSNLRQTGAAANEAIQQLEQNPIILAHSQLR